MPKRLEEELREVLKLRVEEEGIPDFVDKIADEMIGVTVINYCTTVNHPVLEMEPMLVGF